MFLGKSEAKVKKFIVFFIVVCFLAGLQAQTADDYRAAALQGDKDAQYRLAFCYINGNGVAKNYVQAVDWFQKAAEQGHADAQYHLAFCYHRGLGIGKDLTQGIQWLRKAALQEHADAQFFLADCYANAIGVAQNYTQATDWYKRAAEHGNAEAQFNLAFCYDIGLGVPKDPVQVIYWYRKAAEQGHADAQHNLGVCYGNGNGVTQNFVQAEHFIRMAAVQGNAYAQYDLGVCYENGYGVTKDPKQAELWYGKAAQQGVMAQPSEEPATDVKEKRRDTWRTVLGVAGVVVTAAAIILPVALEAMDKKSPSGQGGTSTGTTTTGPSYGTTKDTSPPGGIQPSLKRVTCTYCKGTGKSPQKKYPPNYSGTSRSEQKQERCDVCGEWAAPHWHDTCPSCAGKGYNEKYQ